MYMQNSNELWGMHFFWWCVWIILLVWVFILPFNIPGQRLKKDSPLDTLKKRLASGEIDNDAYQEKKKLLEKN